MLKVGIVGLPNVGKSTLFNALLKKRVALSANYPFATVEPNVGVVEVPDVRLERLAEIVSGDTSTSEESLRLRSGPPSEVLTMPPIVPAVVEFVDIAGLVKGAHKGEGLGNQFLSHIREVDAIIHVLRDFDDENVARAGSENPESDRSIVETELALADLQTLEKIVDAAENDAKHSNDTLEKQKLHILKNLQRQLEQGQISHDFEGEDERLIGWFGKLPLLSLKPTLEIYNVSESEYSQKQPRKVQPCKANSLAICAKLEEELLDLPVEERKQYLKELGIEETGLERLIKEAYRLLGLISFLTGGPKEVRAWTVKQGTKAPQAAGVIHTDFEKGFIKAEVISYEDLIEVGSFLKGKQLGKMRLEGKDYIIRDGDVVLFRFST